MHDELGNRSEFYEPEAHRRDPKHMDEEEVREELKLARTRLLLASAFVDLLRYAYSALQTHGVNYLMLKSYKDTELLDDAARLPLTKGSDRYISWVGRVKNDITASVARQRMKAVFHRKTPPKHPHKDK